MPIILLCHSYGKKLAGVASSLIRGVSAPYRSKRKKRMTKQLESSSSCASFGHGWRIAGETGSVSRYNLPLPIPLHPYVRYAQLAFELDAFDLCFGGHPVARHRGVAIGTHFQV